jgi:hypothetical protein
LHNSLLARWRRSAIAIGSSPSPATSGDVSDQKGNSKDGCQQELISGHEFMDTGTLVVRVLAQDPDVVNARCMPVDQSV